ncbi:metallophosphoesterase [Methylobacterium sp. C25]|uniref:metallophosphoesterase n=1 Tax=Methylobacterium sp. C25 TaxID=2721622 RepID=UPI001F37A65F|nr:metallophosphoesterase family protein [Methylobacterium sp. C25]MCE4222132.1 metallophosphoesterase [Methylobacterium sp. C25]
MTTRLWILSDLHLGGTHPLDLTLPEHDVVVIAGDVDERLADRVLPWLHNRFDRPLVYVPGNHCYWHGRASYQSQLADARELAAASGIHLLAEGDVAEIAGVRFVGATLWTDWSIRPGARGLAQSTASDRNTGMRDVRRIRWRRGPGDYSAFHPSISGGLHAEQRRRIDAALAVPFAGRTVVVTHHAPHERSLRGGEWRELLDAAYASDLSSILQGPHAPDLWIHGHIHESRDYRVGETRIVCNPRGYVTERRGGRALAVPEPENRSFDPALVITV